MNLLQTAIQIVNLVSSQTLATWRDAGDLIVGLVADGKSQKEIGKAIDTAGGAAIKFNSATVSKCKGLAEYEHIGTLVDSGIPASPSLFYGVFATAKFTVADNEMRATLDAMRVLSTRATVAKGEDGPRPLRANDSKDFRAAITLARKGDFSSEAIIDAWDKIAAEKAAASSSEGEGGDEDATADQASAPDLQQDLRDLFQQVTGTPGAADQHELHNQVRTLIDHIDAQRQAKKFKTLNVPAAVVATK